MMSTVPEHERYPVSQEEMGRRYKNWMDVLAMYMVIAYNVGKEVGGDKYVERMKEEFAKLGEKSATFWMTVSHTTEQELADCCGIARLQDHMDDMYANFWDGYIENTPEAFEKEVYTCPVARAWSRQPELCSVLLQTSLSSLMKKLNPKFKPLGFSKLMVKGDKTCRFRIEMEK